MNDRLLFPPVRAVFLAVLVGTTSAPPAVAEFGLEEQGGVLVVDSGAGLVFQVDRANGNLISLRYKKGPELAWKDAKRASQIASGLGAATRVTGEVVGPVVKITIAADETNAVARSLTHYLIVRNGLNNIYMATFPTEEPRVGELRWITRLQGDRFPNSPKPSDVRDVSKTIESRDVFGRDDGTTRSKYYGEAETHGKDRAIDLTYCGVSGFDVGVWMVYGSRESSSGGPFHRDIQNQSAEVYNYMNSGHNMTEPPRLNVLHGPYALVFTDGRPPTLPLDFSWLDRAGLNLKGYVPESGRGVVSGVAAGLPGELPGVVGFSNPSAQYWTRVGEGGGYECSSLKPGNYDVRLYQGELAVGSGSVVVRAGERARLDLTATPIPPALWRIGEWDGTPLELLNGGKLTAMHPSDVRMGSWGPIVFNVGVDPPARFPSLQLRGTNNPTTIKFRLAREQIASRVLRIGITCGYGGGRPEIAVNGWRPSRPPALASQPRSRSFTIGTYRGNNATFAFTVPADAFVVGVNSLTINPASGSRDLSPWLSPGWAYDAVQLDARPAD